MFCTKRRDIVATRGTCGILSLRSEGGVCGCQNDSDQLRNSKLEPADEELGPIGFDDSANLKGLAV